MASEAIQQPFELWPTPTTNGSRAVFTFTNTSHYCEGWYCPNAEAVVYDGRLVEPIRGDINGTPNGKLRIFWLTNDTNTTNAVKFTVSLSDVAFNTDVVAPAAHDQASSTVTDVSNGYSVENSCDVTISGPSLTAGRGLVLRVMRDPGDASDTLAADVMITRVLMVADT